jgi:hypothetical protein
MVVIGCTGTAAALSTLVLALSLCRRRRRRAGHGWRRSPSRTPPRSATTRHGSRSCWSASADVPWSVAYLRARLAEHPAEGYKTWDERMVELDAAKAQRGQQ